jgi:hypothetical protein
MKFVQSAFLKDKTLAYACRRIRTLNLLIYSPAPYPLGYRHHKTTLRAKFLDIFSMLLHTVNKEESLMHAYFKIITIIFMTLTFKLTALLYHYVIECSYQQINIDS